jgi:hypothetical protein
VERDAGGSLGDQGQHDVAAVVVCEALARRELHGVALQNREVLLGRRELVHRNREHVLVRVVVQFFVEVVADSRAVREQVFDRHVISNEREIASEHRPRRRRQAERSLVDQADDRERREPFRSARDRELRLRRVRDLVRAMRESVGAREFDVVAAVDSDGSRESGRPRERVDLVPKRPHQRTVQRPGAETECTCAMRMDIHAHASHAVARRELETLADTSDLQAHELV